jgi:hypothetical protein
MHQEASQIHNSSFITKGDKWSRADNVRQDRKATEVNCGLYRWPFQTRRFYSFKKRRQNLRRYPLSPKWRATLKREHSSKCHAAHDWEATHERIVKIFQVEIVWLFANAQGKQKLGIFVAKGS